VSAGGKKEKKKEKKVDVRRNTKGGGRFGFRSIAGEKRKKRSKKPTSLRKERKERVTLISTKRRGDRPREKKEASDQ